MVAERASNDSVPVDALLAALRRAAEEDGVEDVDAVVAEFATFVRAQAPYLASSPAARRSTSSWTTALLAAGALTTAAFGAVASGVVPNPFLGTGTRAMADTSDASDASDAGDLGDGSGVDGAGVIVAPAVDGNGASTPSGGAPAGAGAHTATYTDPDFLAVVAEQRAEQTAETPVPPITTPSSDPAGDATATTAPTVPAPDETTTTQPADDTTTTTTTTTETTTTTAPSGEQPGDVMAPLQASGGDASASTSGSTDPDSPGGAG